MRAFCHEYFRSVRLNDIEENIAAIIGLRQKEICPFRRNGRRKNPDNFPASRAGINWNRKNRYFFVLNIEFCLRGFHINHRFSLKGLHNSILFCKSTRYAIGANRGTIRRNKREILKLE